MKGERFSLTVEDSARFLLLLLSASSALTAAGLLAGIPVNLILGGLAPLAFALADLMTRRKGKDALPVLGLVVPVLAVSLLLAALTVDQGFDSNSYHKLAVGFLNDGWNPTRMTAEQFRLNTRLVQGGQGISLLWAEVNAKAAWYAEAVLVQLTGYIESGKALNWLFAFALAGQLMGWLRRRGAGLWLALPAAFLGAFHPAACAQLSYYYLDGLAGTALIGLFLAMSDCLEFPGDCGLRHWMMLGCWLFWGCGLKASILFFTVTLCAAYLAVKWIHTGNLPLADSIRLAGLGMFSCGAGGFSPYLTNLFRYGTPLYGTDQIFGRLVSMDEEMGIAGLDNAGRFWASTFGRMGHGEYHTLGELLKVPFTFRREELRLYFIPDPHTGGFGILFSGLLLLGLALLAVSVTAQWRRKKINAVTLFFAISAVLTLVELSLLPGTYTARYEPHLFGIVLYLLAVLALRACRGERKALAAYGLAVALCAFNMLPWVAANGAKLKTGLETERTLRRMAASGESYEVCFGAEASGGMELNLAEKGISYRLVHTKEGENWQETAGGWIAYRHADK